MIEDISGVINTGSDSLFYSAKTELCDKISDGTYFELHTQFFRINNEALNSIYEQLFEQLIDEKKKKHD